MRAGAPRARTRPSSRRRSERTRTRARGRAARPVRVREEAAGRVLRCWGTNGALPEGVEGPEPVLCCQSCGRTSIFSEETRSKITLEQRIDPMDQFGSKPSLGMRSNLDAHSYRRVSASDLWRHVSNGKRLTPAFGVMSRMARVWTSNRQEPSRGSRLQSGAARERVASSSPVGPRVRGTWRFRARTRL